MVLIRLEVLDHLLLLDVIHLKSAHLCIVGGIDNALALAVECHKGGVVELDAVDVLQLALFASGQVYLRQVWKTAWRIHGGIGLTRCRVANQWRNGAQRLLCQRLSLRYGVLAYGGEVLLLVLQLVLLPFVPGLTERLAVNLLELPAEEGVAVGSAVVEPDHLVVAVGLRQVVDEARAVEIGVGAYLEVHR